MGVVLSSWIAWWISSALAADGLGPDHDGADDRKY
jgi:hypothetical protein